MNRTLISVLSGLGGMLGWGTSDFFANITSEKIGHTKALFWSQLAGLVLMGIVVILFRPSFDVSPFLWGLTFLSGIAYSLGYLFFYKGFEIGNVSVVSAVVNFQVIFVIAISLLRGQRLSFIQIPAVILLLVGVTLVSVNFDNLKQGTITLLKGVKETLLATAMFGIFYWPINEYIVEKADWLSISLVTKAVAILTVFLISFFKKEKLVIAGISSKLIFLLLGVGLLEALGVLSVSFGQSYGDGIIVAPISSALTVVTVSLAMLFLKEKITNIQTTGIVLVVLGIVLSAF